jgi:predicted membrane channel-forming protein YqfA (hemolysin III family)
LFGGVLYGTIAWMFGQIRKVDRRYSLFVLSVLGFMFLVEIKEPFLYQNSAARLIFLLSGGALYLVGLNRDADSAHNRRP